jgi:putative PIN family toxin of toxin-antitoxin system
MKIVCDSNVIISAMLFPGGAPDKILQLVVSNQIQNHISPDILTEIKHVLDKKFKLSVFRSDEIIGLITQISILTYPKLRVNRIQADPSDNRVLECACEAKVETIVTGDKKHLLPLKKFEGIFIVSPAQFIINSGIV